MTVGRKPLLVGPIAKSLIQRSINHRRLIVKGNRQATEEVHDPDQDKTEGEKRVLLLYPARQRYTSFIFVHLHLNFT